MLSDGWDENVPAAMPAGVGRVAVVVRPPHADQIVTAAEESLRTLRTNAAFLEELAGQAEGLEARMQTLTWRERELTEGEAHVEREKRDLDTQVELLSVAAAETEARRQDLVRAGRELDEAVAENAVTAADLARREADLQSAREQMQMRTNQLSREQEIVEEARAQLEERADELDRREARFASRWRWLLRAWRWRPPLPGGKARLCELLFVPSSDGYKLLEQEGVALRRGATITGLLAEERTFVVRKIAPWSFDGRWCAYLQQEQP
jgi:chromosome segregation ATPase